MLPGKPEATLRHPLAHSLDIGIAGLEADLKVAVAPAARELVVQPLRGVATGGSTGRGFRVVAWQARVVRPEPVVQERSSGPLVLVLVSVGGNVG